jgi:DNA-binding winged helix-turn-helix (wHTH) protein
VVHKGREIMLQPRQFELALELFRNVGRLVYARVAVELAVARRCTAPDGARALDVCVANVRRKLELRRKARFTLHAVYRRGYQLRATPPRTRLDAGLALATAPKPPTFAHAEGALNGLALGPAASLGPDAGLQLS